MKKIILAIMIVMIAGNAWGQPFGITQPGTYDGHGKVIDATGYNQGIYVYSDNVLITGYEIRNSAQNGIQVHNSKNVIIDSVKIRDCAKAGVLFHDGSDDGLVKNSTVSGNGQYGIRATNSNRVKAVNNTVRDLHGEDSRGLDFDTTDGGEAIQNSIYNIGQISIDGAGIETYDSVNFTAIGNTIFNVRSGIESKAGSHDIRNHLYLKNRITGAVAGIEYGEYPIGNGFYARDGSFDFNTIYADMGFHFQVPQRMTGNVIRAKTPIFIDEAN